MIELNLPDYDGWEIHKFDNDDEVGMQLQVEFSIEASIWQERQRIIKLFEDEYRDFGREIWLDAIRIVKFGRNPYGGSDD